jgi:ComF family protein
LALGELRHHLRRVSGSLTDWVTQVVYPMRCPVCGGVSEKHESLWCSGCAGMVQSLAKAVCPECHGFRPFDTSECKTGHVPLQLPAVYALGVFDHAWRAIVHAVKYEGRTPLADSLGELFAQALRSGPEIDLIVPIPTDKRKRSERGFGHAELIAEAFARDSNTHVLENGLYQTRRIPDQTRLSGPERVQNMAGAFAVTESAAIAKQRVLVIDDVMTTGATLREAARVLADAGASSVLGAVVALNLESVSDL